MSSNAPEAGAAFPNDDREPAGSDFTPLTLNTTPKAALVVLALITATGGALRCYGLSHQSLWFDEVCSWHTAFYPSLRDVWSADRAWNMYPPGYGLLLHAVIALLGDSEVALRLPSAMAGIIAIPLFYCLAARIYSWREGLLAAGLTAASLFPVYFAQEARPYALLLCGILLSSVAWTYLFDAWSRAAAAPRAMVALWFIASVACAYLHYFGMFFVFLQGLVTFALLARTPKRVVRAALYYAATAIAFAPWMPGMAWHLQHQNEGPQNPKPDADILTSFYQYVDALFSHGATGTFAARAIVVGVAICVLVLSVRSVTAYVSGAATRKERLRGWARFAVFAAWLVVPFVLAYVKSTYSASVFTHRNLIISLPVVYLITARAFVRLPLPKTVLVGAAVLLLAGAAARLAFSGYYTAPHKDQLREAVAFVHAHEAELPAAGLVVYSHLPFTFDYYLRRFGSHYKPAILAGRADQIPAMREWVQKTRPPAVWYLCTDPYPENAFVDYMNKEFVVRGVQRFLRTDVFLMTPR